MAELVNEVCKCCESQGRAQRLVAEFIGNYEKRRYFLLFCNECKSFLVGERG